MTTTETRAGAVDRVELVLLDGEALRARRPGPRGRRPAPPPGAPPGTCAPRQRAGSRFQGGPGSVAGPARRRALTALTALTALRQRLDRAEGQVVRRLARHSITLLRFGMGVVFLWFGVLKFFPGLSPAEDLASRTIAVLTLGVLPAGARIALLAALECAIGLGLLTGRLLRPTLVLLTFQMAGTFVPLALFPQEVFGPGLFAPTLEGQYILKNLVLLGAGAVIGATVRGGHIVPEPVRPTGDREA